MSLQTYTPLAHVYGCSCRGCKRQRREHTRKYHRRSRGQHWWSETDGRRPRGEPGLLALRWHPHMGMASYRDGIGRLVEFPVPQIADLRAWRDPDRPWLLEVWETLPIKAPGPHLAMPWCCYIHTVIFYTRPHQTLPPKRYLCYFSNTGRLARPEIRNGTVGEFARYGQVETRLQWNVLLDFAGDTFEKVGGTVIWSRPTWWMRYRFRRVKPGERLQSGGVFNP